MKTYFKSLWDGTHHKYPHLCAHILKKLLLHNMSPLNVSLTQDKRAHSRQSVCYRCQSFAAFDCVLDVVTVVSSSVGIWAAVNTTFRCMSPSAFSVGGATVTFSDMKLEAYMPGNDLSPAGMTLITFPAGGCAWLSVGLLQNHSADFPLRLRGVVLGQIWMNRWIQAVSNMVRQGVWPLAGACAFLLELL